jgi:peptide deformylase
MSRSLVAFDDRAGRGKVALDERLDPTADCTVFEAGGAFESEDLPDRGFGIAVLLWHTARYFIMRRSSMQGKTTEIRTYGDATLRRHAEPVDRIDSEVRAICETMVEAMLRADGAGIAAPQIGISKRIIVLDVEGEFHILINPELVQVEGELEEVVEGCLSVPGVSSTVQRWTRATIAGTTLEGERIEITGEGILARAIQHEMDHLNGHLFIDHVTPARRRSLLQEYRRKRRRGEGEE